ncbi:pyridoxamine 5'-phosphate oxidase family protein [Streptomyces sp. NPDC005963]|uniref:pyridoxamine 5'-phosphate oxidase family protein n=1 Tax=Streptomyces sp. NPDC005963 TaxID=3156721 RepID=UPI0033F4F451
MVTETPSYDPPRSAEQRKHDVLTRLSQDQDVWVATSSLDGGPCLVPLSFVWDEDTVLMSTRRTNPTATNLTPRGPVVLTLGTTRDVVLIKGSAEVVEHSALATRSGDAFATKMNGWDPRGQPQWIYLRVTPKAVQAWREVNELADRDLMREGAWLV